MVATDLDGDRKTDLYCDETTQPLARAGTAGAIPDVMTAWTNGIGATSAIAYAPSSTFPNVNNPPVVPVVVATTTSDGRGGSATSTFSYQGGLMDRQERRFLGFAHQREIQPCEVAPCPVHDLHFAQDYGSASQVKRDEQRDGRRRLLEVTENDYATNGATVPYTSLLAATRHHSFAGDGLDDEVFAPCKTGGHCRTTYATHEYDAYGNERRTVEHGDLAVTGDERRVERAFYANTTAFIVDRPGWETWMTGASGGALLQQTIFLYDGSSIWDQPPQRGERTAMLRWHDASNSFVQASTSYDAFGNQVSSTDETGLVATIEYDAGHLFAKRPGPKSTWETDSTQYTHSGNHHCGKGLSAYKVEIIYR